MTEVSTLIDKAIKRFGTQAKTAKAAGVAQPVVSEALKTGRVGPKLALGLHRATGGEINKAVLRPDLWSEDETAA